MALTAVTGSRQTWWMTNRPGDAPNGTLYTGLVSDLAAGDFLCGTRCSVVSTGSTTSGNRTLTLKRIAINHQWTQTMVATSGIMLVRP